MHTGFESAQLPVDAVEIARVVGAWGVKGWIKILPYSAAPEALFSSKRWFLLPAVRSKSAFEGCIKLAIKEAKEHSDYVVACTRDLWDRDTAQALRGARIFVSRESFPTAAANEYYWVDLIGLDVTNRHGQSMGVVRELLTAGPQTVLVLGFEHDGKLQERMIPFVSRYVDDVDVAARVIRVDWSSDY